MSTPRPSFLSSLWLKYKALNLPWRRRWLAGIDLYGNQYYYYRPTLSSPFRRILRSNPSVRYSDLVVPPQWHQWLRYTRPSPPSLQEQQADVVRQQQLKQLAKQADDRWNSKPSVLDMPRRGNRELAVGDGEAEGTVGKRWVPGPETGAGETREKPRTVAEERERAEQVNVGGMRDGKEARVKQKGKEKQNPWKKAQQGRAGEAYQPQAWVPGAKR